MKREVYVGCVNDIQLIVWEGDRGGFTLETRSMSAFNTTLQDSLSSSRCDYYQEAKDLRKFFYEAIALLNKVIPKEK